MAHSYLSELRHYLLGHRCRNGRRRTSASLRAPHVSRFTLESLEPRVLLSAAPAEVCAELSADGGPLPPDSALSAQASAPSSSTARHELVIVDEQIQDPEQLLSGFNPASDVVWLDSEQDGIAQISAALADRHDLDAIHFVTHGSEGLIKLGNTWLMQETLPDYAEQIQGWRSALANDADLLFYTCDLGSSEAGQGLLASIQSLTGADLAASTNGTGYIQYGADWDLEFQLGSIDTGPLLSQSVQDMWSGLLATVTVSNSGDAVNGNTGSIALLIANTGGDGISLREAITAANNTSGLDTINFSIPGISGPVTINVGSTGLGALPIISDSVIIDGYTQPGASANTLPDGTNAILRIVLDGTNAGVGADGLVINAGGSTIRGLVINNFGQNGIRLITNGGNVIEGNYVGTNATGDAPQSNGASSIAVLSDGNRIGGTTAAARNLISGNSNARGIAISGNANLVQGNYIGINAAGTSALPNLHGVNLSGTASGNVIGGTEVGARNVISGHRLDSATSGVNIEGSGPSGNFVQGNYIGTDPTGAFAIPNSRGLNVGGAANTIGGTAPGTRNLISGNTNMNVNIGGNDNLIQGNYIGTEVTGTSALLWDSDDPDLIPEAHTGVGVFLQADATGTRIGGANDTPGGNATGAANVISGNVDGVNINNNNSPANGNIVEGNYIGTDVTGLLAVPNTSNGVQLHGVSGNIIGGTTAATRNVIAGNLGTGVNIQGASTGNSVQGNYIGLNRAGNVLGNGGNGVRIVGASTNNTIGGTDAGEGNVISGNGTNGIEVSSAGTTGNLIQGNYIGTNAAGTAAVPNGSTGVRIENASTNTIGGTVVGARNVISGHTSYGVRLTGAGATGNLVQGNYIGTNAGGTAALPNSFGIFMESATSNTIGGTTPGARNLISGNLEGILFVNANSNVVQGNFIGTDVTGLLALPNGIGVSIHIAFGNTIGGTIPEARNLISGNGAGIIMRSPSVTGNVVQGNYIGTDVSGTVDLGNINSGVELILGTNGNTIGGPTAGERNIISGNDVSGVVLSTDANGNFVQGNYIGIDAAGTAAVPNGQYGILIQDAQTNTIGGTVVGARNVISGNTQYGVLLTGATATGNLLQGNYIGANAAGAAAVANGDGGVIINNGSSNNTIGGTAPGMRNIISGNQGGGISISSELSSGNIVQGNYIGTDVSGTGAIGNMGNGIGSFGPNTLIGGTVAGAGNLISANGVSGVEIGGTGSLIQSNLIGTNAAGTAALGNAWGVSVIGAAITIGGTAVGAGNTIAFNTQDGVVVTSTSTGSRIQGNAIYSNGQLGIDLGDNGLTPNDTGDADTGPNNLQNFPVLMNAAPGSAVITGMLNSVANTSYTVEFFSNPAGTGDPTGFGEGRTFLGRTAVTTNASGNAAFAVTLTTSVLIGELVTATATDPSGNTSEFSQFITVANSIVTTAVLNVTTNGSGTGRITSLPLGIDTTVPLAGFTESYPLNTVVTLTATPTDPDGTGPLLLSTFGGWTGAGLSSMNPILTLTMDQARTVTATFNPAGSTAPPPPVVNFVAGTSIFARSLTITWTPPAVVPQGYLVRVGTQDGLYDPVPYFVPGTKTSLTLTNLPGAQHYFTVSAVYALGTLPLEAGLLESLAAPTAVADQYFVPRGVSFQTVPATGVLANDTDPDGDALTAQLVAPSPHGTVTLGSDGSFIFAPTAAFTSSVASTTFTYSVTDGTTTSSSVTVTITIAQESGQSQQASTMPVSGLDGWTVLDQGTVLGPSNWAGQDPSYSQASGIDTPGTAVAQLGTLLYSTDGLAQGRTDYRLTMNLTSTTSGALGVTFRYVDEQNHYRFSMERDPNGDGNTNDGYRRLIKMVNGTPTVLREEITNAAYSSGEIYPLEITAQTQPNGDAALGIILRNPTGAGLVNWAVIDPVAATPFTNNGLALYSAGNPGSGYELLGIASLETPSQLPLEVRTQPVPTTTGVGTVIGRVNGVPVLTVPGAPVASFLAPTATIDPTIVTLTATPGSGSTFAGWTGMGITGTDPNPTIEVTMNQAKIITAQFGGAATQIGNLDADGSGSAVALEDGIMITRYLFGVRGPALTAGAVNPIGTRTNPTDIASYLDSIKNSLLDVDASGSAVALEDGIMITRYLFGVRGPALTAGAVNPGGQQTGSMAIADFLSLYDLNPLTNPVTTANSQLSAFSAQQSGSAEPSAIDSSTNAALSTQSSALPGAVAATQLSRVSVQSAPWLAGFLGSHQEDEDVVVVLA